MNIFLAYRSAVDVEKQKQSYVMFSPIVAAKRDASTSESRICLQNKINSERTNMHLGSVHLHAGTTDKFLNVYE